MEPKYYTRSEFLKYSGISLLSLPALISAFGCGNKPGTGNRNSVDCILTPESIEGPYYLQGSQLRSDIRENKLGVILDLKLRVVDSHTCKPIPQAVVDIWHCDAVGYYSGFPNGNPNGENILADKNNPGSNSHSPDSLRPKEPQRTNELHVEIPSSAETFLRGSQVADENGVVRFTSIYPGWYPGRAIHIHCKIFLQNRLAVTTQLYLPQPLNNEIHAEHEPYIKRFPIPVANDDDLIFRQGGKHTTLKAKRSEGKVIAELTMGIKHV